jgi:hypothetical protein
MEMVLIYQAAVAEARELRYGAGLNKYDTN